LYRILSYTYRFEDDSLDAENNYLLNRLGLCGASRRQILKASLEPAGDRSYRIVQHYIPAELKAGSRASYNVRVRNTGSGAWSSDLDSGHLVSSKWVDGVADAKREHSSLPIPLLAGRELTVPLTINCPNESGEYLLMIGLTPASNPVDLIDPLCIKVKV